MGKAGSSPLISTAKRIDADNPQLAGALSRLLLAARALVHTDYLYVQTGTPTARAAAPTTGATILCRECRCPRLDAERAVHAGSCRVGALEKALQGILTPLDAMWGAERADAAQESTVQP